ncbi:MAG: hypothetical protein WAN92_03700 [Herbaspirillum sp.]
MTAALMHNGARMQRTGKPGSALFTPAIPTVAVNGELFIRAKRSIVLQVGESANRGRCINRQALRSVTAGLARLYPDNPNTSILFNIQARYPMATAVQTGLAQGWRTRLKEFVKSAWRHVISTISS